MKNNCWNRYRGVMKFVQFRELENKHITNVSESNFQITLKCLNILVNLKQANYVSIF